MIIQTAILETAKPIKITPLSGLVVNIKAVEAKPLKIDGVAGIPGARGPAGQAFVTEYIQSFPAGTWIVQHNFGRPAIVHIYTLDGEEIEADVLDNKNVTTIIHGNPITGRALLI